MSTSTSSSSSREEPQGFLIAPHLAPRLMRFARRAHVVRVGLSADGEPLDDTDASDSTTSKAAAAAAAAAATSKNLPNGDSSGDEAESLLSQLNGGFFELQVEPADEGVLRARDEVVRRRFRQRQEYLTALGLAIIARQRAANILERRQASRKRKLAELGGADGAAYRSSLAAGEDGPHTGLNCFVAEYELRRAFATWLASRAGREATGAEVAEAERRMERQVAQVRRSYGVSTEGGEDDDEEEEDDDDDDESQQRASKRFKSEHEAAEHPKLNAFVDGYERLMQDRERVLALAENMDEEERAAVMHALQMGSLVIVDGAMEADEDDALAASIEEDDE